MHTFPDPLSSVEPSSNYLPFNSEFIDANAAPVDRHGARIATTGPSDTYNYWTGQVVYTYRYIHTFICMYVYIYIHIYIYIYIYISYTVLDTYNYWTGDHYHDEAGIGGEINGGGVYQAATVPDADKPFEVLNLLALLVQKYTK